MSTHAHDSSETRNTNIGYLFTEKVLKMHQLKSVKEVKYLVEGLLTGVEKIARPIGLPFCIL